MEVKIYSNHQSIFYTVASTIFSTGSAELLGILSRMQHCQNVSLFGIKNGFINLRLQPYLQKQHLIYKATIRILLSFTEEICQILASQNLGLKEMFINLELEEIFINKE